MKVVILAGGYGTRISEESMARPKPMIEIHGQPILWHIMKGYSCYGFHEFIICAGYKQQVIKEFFANYYLHRSDVTFDFSSENAMTVHNNIAEPWKVTVVDTGMDTMTGGRIKRIRNYTGGETFLLTYGDGVCDVNIREVVEFHRKHGKLATVTAVQPGGRFGALEINNYNMIERFAEKEKRTADGSMAAIWYWSRRCLITLQVTRRRLRQNRWNVYPGRETLPHSDTGGSGSAWIP